MKFGNDPILINQTTNNQAANNGTLGNLIDPEDLEYEEVSESESSGSNKEEDSSNNESEM
ncbi:hypothetical protein LINGRAHAP2_LOCUS13922 [Linum grandiflorum]